MASLEHLRESDMHLLIVFYFYLHAPVIMNETAIRADFFMLQRTVKKFYYMLQGSFAVSLG